MCRAQTITPVYIYQENVDERLGQCIYTTSNMLSANGKRGTMKRCRRRRRRRRRHVQGWRCAVHRRTILRRASSAHASKSSDAIPEHGLSVVDVISRHGNQPCVHRARQFARPFRSYIYSSILGGNARACACVQLVGEWPATAAIMLHCGADGRSIDVGDRLR
jgi:hypothetical protein